MSNYWSPKDYTPYFLEDEPTHSPAEIRAEYSRQRKLTMEQANRLEDAGYGAQADYLRKSMPKLSEIKSQSDVNKHLAQGRALQQSKAYSVKGIKEIQRHIKDDTGEIVPLGDVLGFNDYMKSWRLSAFSALIVPSGEAATLYPEEYQEIGGSFANFYTLYQELG